MPADLYVCIDCILGHQSNVPSFLRLGAETKEREMIQDYGGTLDAYPDQPFSFCNH